MVGGFINFVDFIGRWATRYYSGGGIAKPLYIL